MWIDKSLNYGRHNIESFLKKAMPFETVLDIGAGKGYDLDIAKKVNNNSKLIAIEYYEPYKAILNLKKIAVYQLDIEKERFPLANESVDIIIANQILEHVKEIYWIFHEITRLLRLGGSLIIGVPNLAAFHNRILLFMGRQPTPIQVASAHIRGYTHHGFLKFLNSCWEGGYVEKDFKGSNFYPFPPLIAKPLASIWPNFAWGIFMLFTKVQSYDDAFLRFPIEQRLETNFYLGND